MHMHHTVPTNDAEDNWERFTCLKEKSFAFTIEKKGNSRKS